MRRIKAAFGIVLLVTILCAASHATVQNITNTLQICLSSIRTSAQSQQYEQAHEQAVAMTAYLTSCQHWLELFIKRETIASIAVNLHGIAAYANKECANDLQNEIDKASQQVEMMRHLFFSIF